MLSNEVSGDRCESSVSASDLLVSVMISTYPLANKGYLISFFKDAPDGQFAVYDPVSSLDFEATKLARFLESSSMFLPKGCYYLPPVDLGEFIRALSTGASFFEMDLLAPSSPMQGLFLVKVNEDSFYEHEPEEEE